MDDGNHLLLGDTVFLLLFYIKKELKYVALTGSQLMFCNDIHRHHMQRKTRFEISQMLKEILNVSKIQTFTTTHQK